MKKLGIIAALFILAFSFSVKAEVFMEIDCGIDYSITSEKSLSCKGNLVYEEVSISDIEFEYETNLNINFTELSEYPLTKNGNKIAVHANTPLYDEIMNGKVIFKFTLSTNSNVTAKEEVTFKNFRINNSNEIEVEDVSETFDVEVIEPVNDNDTSTTTPNSNDTTTDTNDTSDNTKTISDNEMVDNKPRLDSNCFLDSITIDKVLVPGFDKNKLEYNGLTTSMTVVMIEAIRSSDKSTVTGLGQVIVRPGTTITRIVTVTAEDNSKKEYKLTITNISDEVENSSNVVDNIEPVKELSKDNTLKEIELFNDKEKIDFTFDNKKDTYNIKIDKKIDKLTIKATLNDKEATFVDKYGPREVKLNEGTNKVLIKTKSASNDAKVYTLNIEVKDNSNLDTSLKSLKINGEVINLVDKIYKYEITVAKNVTKTEIVALATSDKAKVTYKNIELLPGDNNVVVSVTAENGDKKDYTINVIQSKDEEVDNSLQSITVDGYDLGFQKDTKDYVLNINRDTDSLKIILNPSNIVYEVVGNNNLVDGSIITIKVADEEEYKITIKKESSKSNLIIYITLGVVLALLITVITYLIKRKKNNIEII